MEAKAVLTPVTNWAIEHVGERCLLVRLGNEVSIETSRLVHAVTRLLVAEILPGVMDIVPAFTTVAIHFEPTAFAVQTLLPSQQLKQAIERALAKGVNLDQAAGRLIEVPACYGGEYGPDLEDVAQQAGITPEEVIALHTAQPLTLYAFFFSPGNPFAGPLDARLHIPRRKTPRTRVEAGSVAIANGISSIYQVASPGGWNVIARTPWNLFDVNQTPPTRFQLGDQLKFKAISAEEFDALYEVRA